MAAFRILILDGQTTQALACVRSLGRAGHAAFVASADPWPLAGWSRYARGRYRLAAETGPAFAALRDWARGMGIDLVLPLTERACRLVSNERPTWEAHGILVGCAPDELLGRAFDKARVLELAAACGVAVPPTRVPDSLAAAQAGAAELGFPCVIKARSSNAFVGGRFLPDLGPAYARTPAELEHAVLPRRQGADWPLIQRYVPGQGKGVFALCDRGTALAWFAHERLRDVQPSGSGSTLRRAIRLDPRLRAPAERLLKTLAWHGPAMVEFRDDGTPDPWLMEVNGRFWASLQLAISAGVDFPTLWVRLARGERVDAVTGYTEGVTLRWLWGDVKRFLHIMRGPPPGFPAAFPTRAAGLRELFAAQPPGTRVEIWDRADWWPAVGEWVQGIRELATLALRTGQRARIRHRPAEPAEPAEAARPAGVSA